MSRWLAAIAVLAALAGLAAVALSRRAPARGREVVPPPNPPRPVLVEARSNIERADYVGPETCGECHPDKHEAWSGSLHRVMNQLTGGIVAPFSGETLAYGGGTARFLRREGVPLMELTPPGGAPTRTFRVTRTIGARALQEYVGVGDDGVELRLPFGWWIARGGWYPQPYFDSWFGPEYADGQLAFDAFRPDPTPWAARCAWCHNTYPFELRLTRRPGVGSGPESYVALATPPPTTSDVLPTAALVTVGISCESCHLGGRDHADGAPARFGPVSPRLRRAEGAPPADAGRHDARVVNALCAQCHSTPSPRYADGAAARNSTEALDLARGACATAIRCTSCHDPHQRGPGAGAPDAAAHLAACTGCHTTLADPAAARAHAGHDAADASCLDCHMPRIVEGVGGQFVRSHRISSPTDPAMLATAAPNACNLCHLDRSIRWTVDALASGWGTALAPDAAWVGAYGDLDHPVGTVWLTGRHGPPRLAAAAAFARRGDRAALPVLAALLDDAVAHDRMWMLFAVERLLGRRLSAAEYDPLAPPAVRARQAAALRAAFALR